MSKRSLQMHKLRTGCSKQEVQAGQRSHRRSDRRVLLRPRMSIGRSRHRFQRQRQDQIRLPELRQGVRKEDLGAVKKPRLKIEVTQLLLNAIKGSGNRTRSL